VTAVFTLRFPSPGLIIPRMPIDFEHTVEALVRKRSSCRTYSNEKIEASYEHALSTAASNIGLGLLGEKAVFQVVNKPAGADHRFAGYGLIKGARSFIVGRIGRSARAYESYGYLLEHLVLKATDLGLESVWVGYFHPEFFEEVKLAENEIFPAAVVVGHAASRKKLKDRIVRAYVQAGLRRPWTQLFFDGGFRTALPEPAAGPYAGALKLVRLAPSAGNTQPWRVVRENGRPVFHFYMKKVKKAYALKRLHEVDIGIAMAHFELGARHSGQQGEWKVVQPEVTPLPPEVEYRWTWVGRPEDVLSYR
jgi:nitroreductase